MVVRTNFALTFRTLHYSLVLVPLSLNYFQGEAALLLVSVKAVLADSIAGYDDTTSKFKHAIVQ